MKRGLMLRDKHEAFFPPMTFCQALSKSYKEAFLGLSFFTAVMEEQFVNELFLTSWKKPKALNSHLWSRKKYLSTHPVESLYCPSK